MICVAAVDPAPVGPTVSCRERALLNSNCSCCYLSCERWLPRRLFIVHVIVVPSDVQRTNPKCDAGVPKETHEGEARVALSPQGVAALLKAGFKGVSVERGAGALAQFNVCHQLLLCASHLLPNDLSAAPSFCAIARRCLRGLATLPRDCSDVHAGCTIALCNMMSARSPVTSHTNLRCKHGPCTLTHNRQYPCRTINMTRQAQHSCPLATRLLLTLC